MIKVLICDDQAIIREGLSMLLNLDDEIDVLGTANDGAEALESVAILKPDLVMMDLKMPVMNGVEATRKIKEQFPDTRVLVLTTFNEEGWVFDAIRAGAAGYLLKDTPRNEIIEAIKGTMAGRNYVDPEVTGRLMEQVATRKTQSATLLTGKLSEREVEVLRLIARGHSNAKIASTLFLSEGTIRNYISSIFLKLEVSDRTQAALLAVKYGLGELE